MTKIIQLFNDICANNSEKIAVSFLENDNVINKTFYELNRDVEKVKNYLLGLGVEKNQRILAFSTANYYLLVFMFALMKIGASIMYVDIFTKQDKLKNVFYKYKPDYVLVSNKTKIIKVFFREINKIKKIINIDSVNKVISKAQEVDSKNIESKYNSIFVEEKDVALLTMTTGSLGIPKIAIRTQEELYKQYELVNKNVAKTKDECVLTTSYMYNFFNILNGYRTVIANENLSRNHKKLNKIFSMYSHLPITMIITSPDFCLKTNNYYSNLQRIYIGGAILNINEAKRINDKYKDAKKIYIYGSTECNLISMTDLETYAKHLIEYKECLLGEIVEGVKVKIKDGKIIVTSDALLKEYLVEDTTNKLIENEIIWHDTNDCGEIKENKLYYLGRQKNVILVDNKKYYSNMIEQDISLKFKEIKKVAILDVNKDVYLFYELNLKETKHKKRKQLENQLKEFLLENYKIELNRVLYLKAIPCDVKHHTKIDYKKLEKKMKQNIKGFR